MVIDDLGYRQLRADAWRERTNIRTSDVAQHGARCPPVDQMIDLGRTFALIYFHVGDPFHNQLTALKTRHLLTSTTRPYRGLKCRTFLGHVFLKGDR